MRLCLPLLLAIFLSVHLSAQDFDTYKRQQQEAFKEHKQKTQAEWDAYRKKVNAEFAEYLKKPWEEKTANKPEPEPEKEPDIPPVVFSDIDLDIPEDTPIEVDVNIPRLDVAPLTVPPIPYKPKPAEKALTFTYYGTTDRIRFDMNSRAALKGTDEKAVSRFWTELSSAAYDNIVADCQNIRYDRDLCDWAYYKMTEKVAEMIYGLRNERAVFHAWLLAQSGFRVRLGRENGNIHLLLGTTTVLFGKPYLKLEDGLFFLLDSSVITAMNVTDVSFPNNGLLQLHMNAGNGFEKSNAPARSLESERYPAAKASVSCDLNMLAFLQDYPIAAIEGMEVTDYIMYAEMPLSESAGRALASSIVDQIKGKSEAEAANIILNFVQTAFDYKTDSEVWGRERPLFPEETLYYPYSDCEDRAILFCRMVRDMMGLDVAFVSYPGHLAAAVHFNQDVTGDYFLVDGKKYLVCDPTYINAPIGLTMPGMDNKTAQVYLFDKGSTEPVCLPDRFF